jgi:uncharacterized membrane protein YhaH (DUF805 family)
MLDSIRHNLSSLTTFSGRDGRATFWFYVLFLLIIQYVIGMAIALPMLGGAAQEAFQAAKQGASDAEMQARLMASMSGSMRTSMMLSGVVAVVFVLLLVASFVRRLHDSGRPGWIAAIPFVLVAGGQAASMANMETVIDALVNSNTANPAAVLQAQKPLLLASTLTWIGYLIVIVFGVWPSSDGDNAYGAEPDHF